MATEHDAPRPEETDDSTQATPEEAEHEDRINREDEHGGLGEDVKPDPEDAEPSSSSSQGS